MADLRPMGVGEILDGAFTIYRRHFITFLALGVTVLCLPVVLTIYVQLSGALGLGAHKVWPLFVVGLGKGIVIGLIVFALGLVAAISVPMLTKTGVLGGIVALALLVGATWLAAFVACGYGVTTQVVVLEPLGSNFEAFGRSWDLTRDRKLKVLGLALVAFILVGVPSAGIGALAAVLRFSSSTTAAVLLVVAAVLPVILTPVLPCVFTLMYYDLRVRREAFDLELLSQHLGAG